MMNYNNETLDEDIISEEARLQEKGGKTLEKRENGVRSITIS